MTNSEAKQEEAFQDRLISQKFSFQSLWMTILSMVVIWEEWALFFYDRWTVGTFIGPPIVLSVLFLFLLPCLMWVNKLKGPRTREQIESEARVSLWGLLGFGLLMIGLCLFQLIYLKDRGQLTFIGLLLGTGFVSHLTYQVLTGRWRKRWGREPSKKEYFVSLLIPILGIPLFVLIANVFVLVAYLL